MTYLDTKLIFDGSRSEDSQELRDYIDGDGQQGCCPRCYEEALRYGEKKLDGDTAILPWRCSHCGASGKEIYVLEFSGHYHDKE